MEVPEHILRAQEERQKAVEAKKAERLQRQKEKEEEEKRQEEEKKRLEKEAAKKRQAEQAAAMAAKLEKRKLAAQEREERQQEEEDAAAKRAGASPAVLAVRAMEEERRKRKEAIAEERRRQAEDQEKYGHDKNWKIRRMVDQALEEVEPLEVEERPVFCGDKIMVCVRTRPMLPREEKAMDFKLLSFPSNQHVIVHNVNKAVDNSLKLENQQWRFDFAFDADTPNEEVYSRTLMPLIDAIFTKGSKVSMFAYGQTGAGKSFTMMSIFTQSINDMFCGMHTEGLYKHLGLSLVVSFYEVYQGKVFDLFADRAPLDVLEDGDGNINLRGLAQLPADTPDQVLKLLDLGQKMRATRATEMNDTSSRSHAILQVNLMTQESTMHGQLMLIDLAGSEKGTDTPQSDKQTRQEAAEINKSLLSLKECIRALDMDQAHAPFRGSKLTMILRDALIHPNSLSIMIACVSPGFFSCESTINTLRYAERLKSVAGDPAPADDIAEVAARLQALAEARKHIDKIQPPPRVEEPEPEPEPAPAPAPAAAAPSLAKPGAAKAAKGRAGAGAAAAKSPGRAVPKKTVPKGPGENRRPSGSRQTTPGGMGGMGGMAAAARPAARPAPGGRKLSAPAKAATPPPRVASPPPAASPPRVASPPPAASPTPEDTDLVAWMVGIGIGEEDAQGYKEKLAADGFEDVDSLMDLTEEEMLGEYAFKKGHARKILRHIGK